MSPPHEGTGPASGVGGEHPARTKGAPCSPPAQATRTVILGPEVMDVAHGSSFTLSIELQQDNGEVAESKHLQVLVELSRKINRCQVLQQAECRQGPRVTWAPWTVRKVSWRDRRRASPAAGRRQPRAGTRVCACLSVCARVHSHSCHAGYRTQRATAAALCASAWARRGERPSSSGGISEDSLRPPGLLCEVT